MTEPRLRDLYTWLDAHRLALIEHAGAMAEAAGWVRTAAFLSADSRMLDLFSDRCERLAHDLASAIETLDRIYPPAKLDDIADDDTIPNCLRDVLK